MSGGWSFMLRCAAVLLTLAMAPELTATGRWLRLKSANFEVLTDSGPTAGRETLRRFEQIRQVFEARTRRGNLSPLPVRIFVFGGESEFRRFQVHEHAAGYYQGGQERDYIAMYSNGADPYRVVFHEYSHLVLRHAARNVPVWFNEGTAELYSTVGFSGSGIRIGDLIQTHVLTLRGVQMLDLPTLLEVDHSSPHYNERGKSGIFYAQSWALVHMLNFSPGYRPGMANFLEMLLSGEVHALAFQRAFGKTLADVQRDLTQYVRQDRYEAVKVQSIPVSRLKPAAAETLDAVEAELALADLLLAIRKDDAAEEIYSRLAAAHPKNPEIQIALGDLALRRNGNAEARRRYEMAMAMGSSSGRLHYDYAMLLREDGGSDGEVLRHLRQAVKLSPDLFDARHYLGYVSLRERRFPEAIEHLRHAVHLQPQKASVWEYLALAYHYSGDKAHARGAAKSARQAAATPEEVERTEATIHLIETEPPSIVRGFPASPSVQMAGVAPKNEDAKTLHGSKSDSRVEGMLTQVDCLGSSARLHVVSGSGKVFLLVRDPGSVLLRGTGSVSSEFICGPAMARPVAVEYRARPHPTYGTRGEVTAIEFR